MSEPDAGSDLRGMRCAAVRDGDGYLINGTKHFISHADLADYVILFAATGEEPGPRGPRKMITAFLVDMGTPGFEVRPGYRAVSNRGYHNFVLQFDDCRVPASAVLGEEHEGFRVANEWLGSTRLQVAAVCLGRARRAIDLATRWAAERTQFGRKIGKFQGVSFKLADMQTRYEAAELLTLRAAWKDGQGSMTDTDAAMAKLYAQRDVPVRDRRSHPDLRRHGPDGRATAGTIVAGYPGDRFWDGTSRSSATSSPGPCSAPLGGNPSCRFGTWAASASPDGGGDRGRPGRTSHPPVGPARLRGERPGRSTPPDRAWPGAMSSRRSTTCRERRTPLRGREPPSHGRGSPATGGYGLRRGRALRSGFAEAGEEGPRSRSSWVSGHRMRVGPNCYGIINAVVGAALWPDVQGCRRVRSGPAPDQPVGETSPSTSP